MIRSDPGDLLLENGSDHSDVPVWSRVDRGVGGGLRGTPVKINGGLEMTQRQSPAGRAR